MLAIVITFLIGRYTIKESRRIEQYNKFIKNLNRRKFICVTPK